MLSLQIPNPPMNPSLRSKTLTLLLASSAALAFIAVFSPTKPSWTPFAARIPSTPKPIVNYHIPALAFHFIFVLKRGRHSGKHQAEIASGTSEVLGVPRSFSVAFDHYIMSQTCNSFLLIFLLATFHLDARYSVLPWLYDSDSAFDIAADLRLCNVIIYHVTWLIVEGDRVSIPHHRFVALQSDDHFTNKLLVLMRRHGGALYLRWSDRYIHYGQIPKFDTRSAGSIEEFCVCLRVFILTNASLLDCRKLSAQFYFGYSFKSDRSIRLPRHYSFSLKPLSPPICFHFQIAITVYKNVFSMNQITRSMFFPM